MSSERVRMRSKDVLALKDTIPKDLEFIIEEYMQSHPKLSSSFGYMFQMLEYIQDPPADMKEYPIDIEYTFGYSEEFYDLLMEKVVELIGMMEHADDDKSTPLSIGSIDNVGTSLFRRIFFIANEEAIRTHANGEIVYPFIVVDPKLRDIMRNLFLSMYFSELRYRLVPVYVCIAIPFCMNYPTVQFNVRYPIKNIRVEELDAYHLYGGVMHMKEKNPPRSKPYRYVKDTH